VELGVRDKINCKFSQQLINFQNEKIKILQDKGELPEDMDREIPTRLEDMEKEDVSRMFNPFLKLKGYILIFSSVMHVFFKMHLKLT
jgi:hypothetical protein